VKEPLNYSLGGQKIPEASCCKYLGIMIRSDLSWGDQVNYTVQKAWRPPHFVMRIEQLPPGGYPIAVKYISYHMSACDEIRNVTFGWCTWEENYSLLVKLMRDLHPRKDDGKFTLETPVSIYQTTRR